MAGWNFKKASWNTANITNICTGTGTGPLFVFDRTNMTENYRGQMIAISAFSKFTGRVNTPLTDYTRPSVTDCTSKNPSIPINYKKS